MNNINKKLIYVLLVYFTAMLLISCGGSNSGISGDSSGGTENLAASGGLSGGTDNTGSPEDSLSDNGNSASSNETSSGTAGAGSSNGSSSGSGSPNSSEDSTSNTTDNTGGSDATDGSSNITGVLELSLTDASADFQAVYITVAKVDVKVKNEEEADGEAEENSGWITVVEPQQTYNLLELMNGVLAPLGAGELEVGQYGQMRLILGQEADESFNIFEEAHPYANYLIDSEGNIYELKVPSGFNTGIKIINGFSITAAQATELVLDFDAARSVVQAGKKKKFLLKPVIKVLETVESSADGVITDEADNIIEGVMVSAQFYNPDDAIDPKGQVTVESSTMSTAEGSFTLLLPPGTYNIVATTAGYLPACQEGVSEFTEEYSSEISMTPAPETITISGSVMGLDSDEDSATLSIRQEIDCGSGPVMIEVASINVANESNFEEIELPFEPGQTSYNVVVSADGKVTQVIMDIIEDSVLEIVMETVQ